MKISVIGAGYLGATHAVCMASRGHEVIAVDVDEERVALLSAGKLPFYEPGLCELLNTVKAVTFTTDYSHVAQCEIHFLCVGTPQKIDNLAADLGALERAFESLAKHAKPDSLIVGKSTVPVGTAEGFLRTLAKINSSVLLNWNPEFLREGHAIEDTLYPNRIVIGANTPEGSKKLANFYHEISPDSPIFRTNLATAELVKVSANSFLATKISFINAISEIADATGADVALLADAIGVDDRIGRKFLGSGIGFGGGCLPKDIRAFLARAEELGLGKTLAFLREFDEINDRARTRAVTRAVAELKLTSGKKVAVLGASFKPDSDDVRDSPALEIAQSLHVSGFDVVVHDPRALMSAAKKAPELHYSDSIIETLADADLTMHLTEWREYRELDPIALQKIVRVPTIFDGRNVLDVAKWQRAGWKLLALGRSF